jgi:putative holliday junction resolvase
MAIVALHDLRKSMPPQQRLIGLDVGTKTTGLALSDVTLCIASPYANLRQGKFAENAKRLFEIIEREDIGAMVIGLPVEMDGTEGPRCQSVRQFAENLCKIRDIPIAFWDERLSTSVVERMLVKEVDMSRKRRKEVIDKTAAAFILQGALDAINADRK